MQTLRHLQRASARPSIHEIARSILSPSSRCYSTRRPATSLLTPRALSSPSRSLSTTPVSMHKPPSRDRGPASEESTQTDFSNLDVLGGTPVPSTAIDACLWDGFHLNNGVKITNGAGVLLVNGEVFSWKPWNANRAEGEENKRLVNDKGLWEVGDESWGVLGMVWPKPDLLILGLGPNMMPLSPATRKAINSLGIQVEIQDTRNAAAQYNLLATERGLGSVAAALVPLGWRDGVGVVSGKATAAKR
ncbi:hypothetical protein V501_04066 [Pseudogymnoascus sp. VKM F-4519 (FW-2642)]|nr:hypothetical protein V501_04066 [Pseudogymnoascus sp. VKM F-4519 (FW-2642)]